MHLPAVRSRSSARLSGTGRAPRSLATCQTSRAVLACDGQGTKLTWCDLRETERGRWSQRSMRQTAYRPYLEYRPTRVGALVSDATCLIKAMSHQTTERVSPPT